GDSGQARLERPPARPHLGALERQPAPDGANHHAQRRVDGRAVSGRSPRRGVRRPAVVKGSTAIWSGALWVILRPEPVPAHRPPQVAAIRARPRRATVPPKLVPGRS